MKPIKEIREILQELKNEIYPDEFIEGTIVEKYLDKAISLIRYENEEDYNEIMEKAFNEPYPKGEMK